MNGRTSGLKESHEHCASNYPEVTLEARCIEITVGTEEKRAFAQELHVIGIDELMAKW